MSDNDRALAAAVGAGVFGQGVLTFVLGLTGERADYSSYVEELGQFELAPIGPRGSAGVTLRKVF